MDKLSIYFLFQLIFILGDVLLVNTKAAVSRNSKISGGGTAAIQEAPYNALLELYDGRQNLRCGGSIISINVILTAAHCLIGMELASIRIGNTFTYGEAGSTYDSDIFLPHPLFNPMNEEYDVGLVRVTEGMRLDGIYARSINLAGLGQDPQQGAQIDITGWGLTTDEDDDYPSILHKARTTVIDRDECNQLLGGEITMMMFCAGETTRESLPDVCEGDYGSAAVSAGNGNQIGVASYGQSCGEINSPSVYSRIGAAPIRMFIMAFGGV